MQESGIDLHDQSVLVPFVAVANDGGDRLITAVLGNTVLVLKETC